MGPSLCHRSSGGWVAASAGEGRGLLPSPIKAFSQQRGSALFLYRLPWRGGVGALGRGRGWEQEPQQKHRGATCRFTAAKRHQVPSSGSFCSPSPIPPPPPRKISISKMLKCPSKGYTDPGGTGGPRGFGVQVPQQQLGNSPVLQSHPQGLPEGMGWQTGGQGGGVGPWCCQGALLGLTGRSLTAGAGGRAAAELPAAAAARGGGAGAQPGGAGVPHLLPAGCPGRGGAAARVSAQLLQVTPGDTRTHPPPAQGQAPRTVSVVVTSPKDPLW